MMKQKQEIVQRRMKREKIWRKNELAFLISASTKLHSVKVQFVKEYS
jgi:hypothetical protein